MVNNYNAGEITISPLEYCSLPDNAGKVALFNLDEKYLVADGEDTDWVKIELLYEDLRESGNYDLVLVPHSNKEVQSFNWSNQ